MKITKAEIQEIFSEGETKALVTVTIDGCLMIRNFRIIKNPNGTLIGMPTFIDEKGDHTIVLLADDKLTNDLAQAVIAAYNSFVEDEKSRKTNMFDRMYKNRRIVPFPIARGTIKSTFRKD